MEPLVEPGPPLTAEQAETYSRHLLLPQLGEEAQRRLLAARVGVVGAGGLGSPALLYLAAAGVGTIGLIDDDVVDRSNLQRQVLHGDADIGRSKLDSAADRLLEIAPSLRLVKHPARLTVDTAAEILRGYDLVLDGTDNFDTRYAVSDACAALGLPLVWGSVLGFDAQISVFWASAPGGTTLRDLFPEPPAPGSVPSCADAGVLGSLVGQVGSVMATEAIKLITGIGEPLLGRVLVLDGLAQRWAEVPLRPRERRGAVAPAVQTPISIDPRPTQAERETITIEEVRDLLQEGAAVAFLDVREDFEVRRGAIPGALHVPLAQALTERGRAAVPSDRLVIAYCEVGPRSERAAAALRAHGVQALSLQGGYPAWVRAAVSA